MNGSRSFDLYTQWNPTQWTTVEYYTAMKKDEIMQLAVMWAEWEGKMLSQISGRLKNKPDYVTLCGLEKQNTGQDSVDQGDYNK